METALKLRAWIVTAVLVTISAAGCGDDSDGGSDGSGGGGGDRPQGSEAPRDASVEDFCATFEEAAMISGDEAAEKLAATGTPPGIPDDARRGFEYLIDHPEGGEGVINNDDIDAYVTWGSTTCADIINQE